MSNNRVEKVLIDALFYALREGCLTPVPKPKRGASVQKLVQWGAMRHLHDAVAAYRTEAISPRQTEKHSGIDYAEALRNAEKLPNDPPRVLKEGE